MAWLGAIYVLIILGLVFGVPLFIVYQRGGAGGAEHRRRARLIERYARNAVHDAEVMDNVLQRMAWERRRRDETWR